jgi:ABC-type cobalt transport system substrate-binding protein
MKYRIVITTMVTFLIFLGEAMIHYNIGKNSNNNTVEQVKPLYPSLNEFIWIAGIVLLFSFLSGYISSIIIWYFIRRNKQK